MVTCGTIVVFPFKAGKNYNRIRKDRWEIQPEGVQRVGNPLPKTPPIQKKPLSRFPRPQELDFMKVPSDNAPLPNAQPYMQPRSGICFVNFI